jgi:hypothetical protein
MARRLAQKVSKNMRRCGKLSLQTKTLGGKSISGKHGAVWQRSSGELQANPEQAAGAWRHGDNNGGIR